MRRRIRTTRSKASAAWYGARADFDAEIEFLGQKEICDWRDGCCKDDRRYFGTLEMLRRGSWQKGVGPCPQDAEETAARTLGKKDRTRNSLVHAALAKVCYEGFDKPDSIVIYVKPTLVGDEPVDVKHYHEEHADFPQQTTADQFFDEAQWESYRALGELIGHRVLKALKTDDPRKWLSCGLKSKG